VGTQWYRVFDEALRASDVVSVAVTVVRYLGREPTRSERHASRRAANTYALHSNAQLVRVPVGNTRRLLLARVDADLSNGERLADIASSRAAPPPRRGRVLDEPQIVESIAAAVVKAGRAARQVNAGKLDTEHATALAKELEQPLHDLERLRRRLLVRGG